MKVVTEILQDLEILKRLLKHNANLKIRINYYLTILLVRKNKLAYTLQCLNNLFFQKQYETIYISTLANSIDPDQLSSLVNSEDPDQLASEEAS